MTDRYEHDQRINYLLSRFPLTDMFYAVYRLVMR